MLLYVSMMSNNVFWENDDENIHCGNMLVSSNNSYFKQHTDSQPVTVNNDSIDVNIIQYPTTTIFNERLMNGGDYNAAQDYSLSAADFIYTSAADYTFITKLNVYIETPTATEHPSDRYGTIVGGVTNGITINYAGNVLNAETIKSNGDWLSMSTDYMFANNTVSNVASIFRINFNEITTNGIQLSATDTFTLNLNDDFSTLSQHYFTVQGYVLSGI